MLFGEPLASLITFFRMSLMKFYHNIQWMSDSFYHMDESCQIKKMKNKDPKETHLAI